MIENSSFRPFYFNVVLWGRRFREYFLDYCLPSLLSPGNIPSLKNKRESKFLICTTFHDWNEMCQSSIFRRLEEQIQPEFFEIPYPQEGVTGCQHMGIGHKLATRKAYMDRAYFVALTPDLVISEGSIERIQNLAVQGYNMVLVAALRFAEEPFLGELEKRGFWNPHGRPSENGEPLILSGRELTSMAMKSFHSETENYNWDNPYSSILLPLSIWRVNGDEGMILHSFSWAPFLLDYSIITKHDDSAFNEWTFDGDYVYNNFAKTSRIYVVQDSDEVMMVSWAPLGSNPLKTVPHWLYRHGMIRDYFKRWFLTLTYHADIMDPLKRKIFPLAVKWHSGEIGPVYREAEKRAEKYIANVFQYSRGSKLLGRLEGMLLVTIFFSVGLLSTILQKVAESCSQEHASGCDGSESAEPSLSNKDKKSNLAVKLFYKLSQCKTIMKLFTYLPRQDKLWRLVYIINIRLY
jgi:hypothetical protein